MAWGPGLGTWLGALAWGPGLGPWLGAALSARPGGGLADQGGDTGPGITGSVVASWGGTNKRQPDCGGDPNPRNSLCIYLLIINHLLLIINYYSLVINHYLLIINY